MACIYRASKLLFVFLLLVLLLELLQLLLEVLLDMLLEELKVIGDYLGHLGEEAVEELARDGPAVVVERGLDVVAVHLGRAVEENVLVRVVLRRREIRLKDLLGEGSILRRLGEEVARFVLVNLQQRNQSQFWRRK